MVISLYHGFKLTLGLGVRNKKLEISMSIHAIVVVIHLTIITQAIVWL